MPQPFDLNLRHLRALSQIVERGSMSAAARAVSLSQPALTQGLAKLERQLGATLFERRADGVSPTESGRLAAGRAAAAFAHLAAGARGGRGFTRPEQLVTAAQAAAFLHLADSGGFAAAARVSGTSQPAIHRAVRDLEQVLGAALLERRGRGVALTAAGWRMARGVRLAASEIGAAIADLAAMPEEIATLRIGAMPLARARLLPRTIAAFLRDAPPLRIEVIEGSWRELVEPLRDGAIDLMLGALRLAPAPADLAGEALLSDRLTIFARAHHPLAGTETPSLADLARFPWIVGQTDSPLVGQWHALFGGALPPPAPVACGSVMVIRGILAESDALTLLSPDQVALEVERGLLAPVGQPLLGSLRTIGVTTRAGWRPTRLQRAFTDLLRTTATRMNDPEIL